MRMMEMELGNLKKKSTGKYYVALMDAELNIYSVQDFSNRRICIEQGKKYCFISFRRFLRLLHFLARDDQEIKSIVERLRSPTQDYLLICYGSRPEDIVKMEYDKLKRVRAAYKALGHLLREDL